MQQASGTSPLVRRSRRYFLSRTSGLRRRQTNGRPRTVRCATCLCSTPMSSSIGRRAPDRVLPSLTRTPSGGPPRMPRPARSGPRNTPAPAMRPSNALPSSSPGSWTKAAAKSGRSRPVCARPVRPSSLPKSTPPFSGRRSAAATNGPGHVGMQPLPVYDRRVGVDGLQSLAQFRFHAGGIDCDRPES